MIGGKQSGYADVDLFRKQRVLLNTRCKCFEIDCIDIINEENDMRIADIQCNAVIKWSGDIVDMQSVDLAA